MHNQLSRDILCPEDSAPPGAVCDEFVALKGLDFTIHKIQITHRDILSAYLSTGCLSDAIINAYLRLIQGNKEDGPSPPLRLRTYFVDTLISAQMRDRRSQVPLMPPISKSNTPRRFWVPEVRHTIDYVPSNVLLIIQWQANIFEFKLVILPWHVPDIQHWICMVINMQDYTIRCYDSMACTLMLSHRRYCEVCYLTM